ncbi:hypothetical protein [Bdellovibrio sp. HCB209]|uniref:hypothetical protein n=1 Tax=Bdellovibrio sp. HCB209 TaxID=3394354 RepID=UPI0039B5FB2C
MKAFTFALFISGMIFSNIQNPKFFTSSDPEIDGDEMHTMSVCCPVGNAPSCAWPGNFPEGSDCYCRSNGQIFPGTVCSN